MFMCVLITFQYHIPVAVTLASSVDVSLSAPTIKVWHSYCKVVDF